MRERLLFAGCAAYFLWFARAGLFAAWSPDDVMNIYFAWQHPWRPDRFVAQWVLRGLYFLFGAEPLPYRIVCFGLLLGNLWLAMKAFVRFAGFDAAALALVLFCYHAYLSDLYFSGGTIYDLLCFGFLTGALLLYGQRNWWWAALYALALGSKEIAVAFPLLLATTAWWKRGVLAGGSMAAAFLATKLLRGGDMAANPAYQMEFSVGRYLENWTTWWNDLLYLGPKMTPVLSLLLLVAAAALAAAMRKWAPAVWFLGCALPVSFLPKRSLYVLYFPYAGLCLLVGSALGRRWFVAAAAAIALVPAHLWIEPYAWGPYHSSGQQTRMVTDALRRELPAPKQGARILFVDDPMDKDDWMLLMLARLVYRDAELVVDRQKRQPPDGAYDVVLTWDAAGVRRISSANPQSPSTDDRAR